MRTKTETQSNASISLREVIESDLPIFFEHQRDPETAAMIGLPSRERDDFDAHWKRSMANPEGIIRTIVYDGQVAGNVMSFVIDERRYVGYCLGKEFWGKGIATRALDGLLKIVTERPLYAITSIDNAGSQRVLEKCGFMLIEEKIEGDDPIRVFELAGPNE